MKNITKLTLIYLLLFLSTTFVGTIFLYLPVTGEEPVSLIDAFFITSSAFTVTGLASIDISTHFNALGQTIIMLLIQIGGLGIVTLSIFVLILSGKRITFNNRNLLMLSWNSDAEPKLLRLTVQIVVFSLMIEAVGFLFLTMVFVPDYGFKEGSFISIFTSISAFNNAGFGLFSDNLMSYSNDLIVNIVVPALIILGGIGFIVIADIWRVRRFKKLRLHTKIVLLSTLFLIVFGFLSFWLLEADNVLQGLPIHEQIFNAFFQSVTTRTAGFNTVDIGQINSSTLMIFIVLMFIGAAPMSTAGGIKVTTFSLILLHLYARMRGASHPHIFKKSVDYAQINKAVSVFLLAFFTIFSASFIIVLCHPDIDFIKILFEVVSAFGTVGLSTGITDDLNNLSKIVIIIVMILGKIGLFILLTIFQTPSSESYYYAKEKIEM